MKTVAVTRERGDKLAKQVYTFAYDALTHELVLDSYEYCERLSRWKRYAIIAQWRKDLQDVLYTGVDLNKINLDEQIKHAAIVLFTKGIGVVKVPKNILEQLENERLEEKEYEEQIQRTEDSRRGAASRKVDRVAGRGNRGTKKEKK